jgi:Patatin-like phospholipase
MQASSNPYRILCLDGGGRWSLISVMALQAVFGENAKGHDILKQFDLVAANSGGSIVAGGLIENRSLAELLDMFCTSGELFPPERLWSLPGIGHWLSRQLFHFGPKYDTTQKLQRLNALMPTFGGQKLTDVPDLLRKAAGTLTHFVIAGFDFDWRRAKFLRSQRREPGQCIWPNQCNARRGDPRVEHRPRQLLQCSRAPSGTG